MKLFSVTSDILGDLADILHNFIKKKNTTQLTGTLGLTQGSALTILATCPVLSDRTNGCEDPPVTQVYLSGPL